MHKFSLKEDFDQKSMRELISFLRWRNYDDSLPDIKDFVNIYNIQRKNWLNCAERGELKPD